jgi:cytochrome d ubiquinol oxidase subunit II
MTMIISYAFLQHYWWVIISLMAGILVFLMFVQGGQSMLFSLPSNDSERSLIINALGRKWEFTFTTLVTFGGTFFASFPLFYATSFGGAYWLWTVILFSFIIQAVSYEYRSKAGNVFGQKTFDSFLLINGSVGPFLIGVAVGTFFTGAAFSLDDANRVTWHNDWRGLEALADFRNLSLGLAVLFLSRINGLLFIIKTVDNKSLQDRCINRLWAESLIFLLLFVYFVVSVLFASGFIFNSETGMVSPVKNIYLKNFLSMPLVLILFLSGVVLVLYGIGSALFMKKPLAIWFTAVGTFLAVFALFLITGFRGTSFYPSVNEPQSSLAIGNASSSQFTLKTMMFFSFAVPFIVAYIWYCWKALTDKKISGEELEAAGHKY